MSVDHCPLVAALPAAEKRRLLDRAVPRRLERGDTLHLTGDDQARVHIVERGILKLAVCDHEGRETILALALPADVVGETAAADGYAQPFDVVAVTSCEVVGLDAALLMDVVARNPAAALELMRMFAARSRWIAATAGERTGTDVPARLAGRLLDLAELIGRMRSGTIELDLPMTRTDVGQLAGMCRESASKTLAGWQRQGLVEHNGKTLRIFRPDALERIRCAGRGAGPFPSPDAEGRRRLRPRSDT